MSSKIHICNCSRCGFRFSRRDDARTAQHKACVEFVKLHRVGGKRTLLASEMAAIGQRIIDATLKVMKETDCEA